MLIIKPFILPLIGPFAIHGYGIAIAVAVMVFGYLSYNYLKRFTVTSFEVVSDIIARSVVVGLIGGRALHVFSEWHSYQNFFDVFALWKGGLSILGTVIAVSIYLPVALFQHSIPILRALDSAALYAPLAHAIGRLGCLWAGCCFGCVSSSEWGIMYQGQTAGAPLGVILHPAQLYSSLCFIAIFIIIRYFMLPRTRTPGFIALYYLIGVSAERFIIDFIRDDRVFLKPGFLSLHQWIALAIGLGALGLLVCAHWQSGRTVNQSL